MDWSKYEIGKDRQEWIFSLEVSVALELTKEWAFLISELFGVWKDPQLSPQEHKNGTVISSAEAPEAGTSGLDPLSEEAATLDLRLMVMPSGASK